MYKEYRSTVRMLVTENDKGLLKARRVSSSFVSAHAP